MMDDKLKEAIATARTGDKREAQRQLTELLDENPQQVQGWYLLSLLVDSPQKQAAYLSKTLALNPQHEKAREQLAALQAEGGLAPTATIEEEARQSLDVLAQSETDSLPDWLREEGGEQAARVTVEDMEDTAVPNETLPDWLKEPASLETESTTPADVAEESETVTVSPTAISDKTAADLEQAPVKPRQAKEARSSQPNTRGLNIVLSLLIFLAIVVMIVLAYLLLT